MPKKLIVAFTTRAVKLDESLLNFDLTPPKTHKKPEAIAEWQAARKAQIQAQMKNQPYTGTFERLWIADPANKDLAKWKYRAPGSGKQSVAIAARNWILKRYPNAWDHSTHPTYKSPDVIFLGFNPRLFLKMIGLECTLPQNQGADTTESNMIPLSMWYTNTDHRDVGEAAMPKEFNLSWPLVLAARKILIKGWNGPGVDVESDMIVATELSTQLGLLFEK